MNTKFGLRRRAAAALPLSTVAAPSAPHPSVFMNCRLEAMCSLPA